MPIAKFIESNIEVDIGHFQLNALLQQMPVIGCPCTHFEGSLLLEYTGSYEGILRIVNPFTMQLACGGSGQLILPEANFSLVCRANGGAVAGKLIEVGAFELNSVFSVSEPTQFHIIDTGHFNLELDINFNRYILLHPRHNQWSAVTTLGENQRLLSILGLGEQVANCLRQYFGIEKSTMVSLSLSAPIATQQLVATSLRIGDGLHVYSNVILPLGDAISFFQNLATSLATPNYKYQSNQNCLSDDAVHGLLQILGTLEPANKQYKNQKITVSIGSAEAIIATTTVGLYIDGRSI